ncbi:MAG TPA: ATP-binding cassette domain-containing protein [Vicinamibacterales bacterium]|nr:ATP-binding cassette domain-containing protein [Vicinamibacterales bacterium]
MTLLDLSGLVRNYHALRPLRVDSLSISAGDHLALVGFDQPAAETLINLITGAFLPDQGQVSVFGQPTSAIADSDQWLAVVDRFGIVSERAVLMDSMTVVQNLAMPFSLEIEPPSDELRLRAATLARAVSIAERDFDRPLGQLDAETRLRVRFARALALEPSVLLIEHPTAALERSRTAGLGRELRELISVRTAPDGQPLSSLTLTADQDFAEGFATTVLTWDPVTGRLAAPKRGWFGSGRRSL